MVLHVHVLQIYSMFQSIIVPIDLMHDEAIRCIFIFYLLVINIFSGRAFILIW